MQNLFSFYNQHSLFKFENRKEEFMSLQRHSVFYNHNLCFIFFFYQIIQSD